MKTGIHYVNNFSELFDIRDLLASPISLFTNTRNELGVFCQLFFDNLYVTFESHWALFAFLF